MLRVRGTGTLEATAPSSPANRNITKFFDIPARAAPEACIPSHQLPPSVRSAISTVNPHHEPLLRNGPGRRLTGQPIPAGVLPPDCYWIGSAPNAPVGRRPRSRPQTQPGGARGSAPQRRRDSAAVDRYNPHLDRDISVAVAASEAPGG